MITESIPGEICVNFSKCTNPLSERMFTFCVLAFTYVEVKVLQTTFFNTTASLLFEHQMIGGKLLVCQFLLHSFSDE